MPLFDRTFDNCKVGDMLSECRRAVEIDQFSPIYCMSLTLAYNYSHDYERALQQANKAAELYPTNSYALIWLGYTYERTRNYKQAMEQWTKLARQSGRE